MQYLKDNYGSKRGFFFESDPRAQEFKGDDQFEHFKNKFTHYFFTNTVTIQRKQTSKACASKYTYFYQNKFFKFFKCKITRSQAINSKYWEQYNQVHVTDTQVTTTNPTYLCSSSYI